VNAEEYERFTRERPLYRALNERLVALAEIGTARRVLDLACGTGATARAALAALPADGEVVGVDASAAMVEVARAVVADRRARFLVAPAAGVERVVAGPFDRVLSNAAFGQFPDLRPVVAAVARLLAPGGLFVFNLPGERLAGAGSGGGGGGPHPFQVALARAVGRGRRTTAPAPIDERVLIVLLDEAGFDLVTRERFVYRGRQGELVELMEIPAMIARAAPEASLEDRAAAVAEARRDIDPAQPVDVPWEYFVTLRRKAPRQGVARKAREATA
jgi:SAM-dependent methyltransferase